MNEITIENIYEIADNEIAKEFKLDRFGETVDPDWNLDADFVNRVFDANINGETVMSVFDCIVDDLIEMGLLYTKKAEYGIIEVHKVEK